jgi:hypothetical protein
MTKKAKRKRKEKKKKEKGSLGVEVVERVSATHSSWRGWM